MSVVEIERDQGRGELLLRFPFDREVIDDLKQLSRTRWSPDECAWRTPAYNADDVEQIFEDLGYTVRWYEPEPPPLRVEPPLPGQQAAQAFLSSLPDRLQQPVHRAVIKVLHPDVGGDTASAQAWNAAYDRVRGAA